MDRKSCTKTNALIVTLVTALVLVGQSSSAQLPAREVSSAEEAVRLAEAFIVEQGYTDAPGKPRAFQSEQFKSDDPRDRDAILAERAGTTAATAYAYQKENDIEPYQWWIYFQYLGEGQSQCPEWFRVVNLIRPGYDYGSGLLLVNDIIRGLNPYVTLLEARSSECPPIGSE